MAAAYRILWRNAGSYHVHVIIGYTWDLWFTVKMKYDIRVCRQAAQCITVVQTVLEPFDCFMGNGLSEVSLVDINGDLSDVAVLVISSLMNL